MVSKPFLLLDIDGVLLKSGGYRRAFIDTANYFLHRLGQTQLSVDESVPETFELNNIRAEWDMVPLTLAAFFNWYAEITQRKDPFGSFPLQSGLPQAGSQDEFISTLKDQINIFSQADTNDGDLVKNICRQVQSDKEQGMLPYLWKDTELLETLLFHALDLSKSETFAHLSTLVLGSVTFSDHFRLDAPFASNSYLREKDQLLISADKCELLKQRSGKDIHSAVMTYRPSVIPAGEWTRSDDYLHAPEAEIAIQMLGWLRSGVRMIGGGDIYYLEKRYKLKRDTYVKPHPLHALACVLFCVCNDEKQALDMAKEMCDLAEAGEYVNNPAKEVLPDNEPVRIAVFEDSLSGIESCKKMSEILRQFGYQVEAKLYGIFTTEDKAKVLTDAGAQLFPDINLALDDYFASVGLSTRP